MHFYSFRKVQTFKRRLFRSAGPTATCCRRVGRADSHLLPPGRQGLHPLAAAGRQGRQPLAAAGQAGPAPTCCRRSAGPTATCCRRTAHEIGDHKLESPISPVFRNSPKNSCRHCRLGQCKCTAWARAAFVKSISQRKIISRQFFRPESFQNSATSGEGAKSLLKNRGGLSEKAASFSCRRFNQARQPAPRGSS